MINNGLEAAIRALPALMMNLLDHRHGFSLERLQLVECEITHALSDKQGWHDVSITKNVEGKDKFVHLSGVFNGLRIRLGYFLRGQKKFFRPSIECPATLSFTSWCTYDRERVASRLHALGHDNTALISRELAQLNGRPDIQVASHVVIADLIDHALHLWPHDGTTPTHFLLTFIEGMSPNQPLETAMLNDALTMQVWVRQDGRLVVHFTLKLS